MAQNQLRYRFTYKLGVVVCFRKMQTELHFGSPVAEKLKKFSEKMKMKTSFPCDREVYQQECMRAKNLDFRT